MENLIDIALRVILIVLAIIALTRLHGLRSFSKLSGFDFAITVAMGSVLAGAITTLSTPAWHFLAALCALFVFQILLSQSRVRLPFVADALDNAPLLIMENGTALPANMTKGGVSESDLWAKLREANAYDLSRVRAVVLESTGDISVLHGPADGPQPDPEIMQNVRRS